MTARFWSTGGRSAADAIQRRRGRFALRLVGAELAVATAGPLKWLRMTQVP
jgi:hypothetical protein